MLTLLEQIVRWIPLGAGVGRTDSVARNLLERAEARAGQNPRQAQELRRSALAYLSVVR